MIFKNRQQAGEILASKLSEYAGQKDLVVLGLARGGVPVAYPVALFLKAPMDVFVVRKLGCPGQPELAMGAIASGGITVLNKRLIQECHITKAAVAQRIKEETLEMERREQTYRAGKTTDLKWKNIILVDDGLATGSTMRAAVEALYQQSCGLLTVAVPVSSPEVCRSFTAIVDNFVCAHSPVSLISVGQWYEDFTQTSDEEVSHLLDQARAICR